MPLTQTDKDTKIWQIDGWTAVDVEVWPEDNPVWIKKIVWRNVQAAGDKLNVRSGRGEDIILETADAGSTGDTASYEYTDFNSPYQGLTISDMDSGRLYIYIE